MGTGRGLGRVCGRDPRRNEVPRRTAAREYHRASCARRLQAAGRSRRAPLPPDAFVVAPATFNTINKWANGISDTLALGLLNEGLCAGRPIIAVPTPNVTLARHPAFARSVEFLRKQGVRVLFGPDTYPLPTPNLGEAGRTLFLRDALKDEVVATLSP